MPDESGIHWPWLSLNAKRVIGTMVVNRRRLTYSIIGAIFLASLAMIVYFPAGSIVQAVMAIPFAGSLIGAIYQILRDQAAHDRAILLLDAQNRFTLGATSHMAIVAFDKHVQFSEKYVAEVHKLLTTLFHEGPTAKVFEHTTKLYQHQQEFSVWLTPSIMDELESFELAVRRLGAKAEYLNVANAADDNRQTIIANMYKEFADLLGAKFMGSESWKGERLTEEKAISKVIHRFRVLLGTEELTELRSALVSKALSGPSREA